MPPPTPKPLSSPVAHDRRLKRAIAWVTVVALLAVVALRGYDHAERRHQTLREGEQRAANLALMLAAHMREAFAAADTTLRQLAVYSRQIGGPPAAPEKWSPLLAVSRTQRNGLGSISVADTEGIIRHSTVPTIVGSSRRDQYVFRRLSSMERDMLVADTPFRAVTDTKLMLLPLGRRLTTPEGRFAGIIVATFTPAHLRDFFSTVDIGRGGHIWVFHPEGQVMFHVPSARDPIGENALGNPLFHRGRHLGEPEAFRLPASRENPAALVALHPVGEPRVFIAVSLPQDEILADWHRDLLLDLAVIVAIALAFAALLRFMFRQIDGRAAAEQSLAHAQRLEALGKLTGGVAHDFNNLLTVIMMNVSALKLPGGPGATGSGSAEPVRQIEDAAKRAATLTQQLLTFARKQSLQPRHVDLNQRVRDMQPMLERVLGEDVILTLGLARESCPIEVDVVQLETALLNLCLNARDAMPAGGPLRLETSRVSFTRDALSAGNELAPGDYVQLAVIDRGCGIPARDLGRIFEPFFTTKPVGQGTGLGLAMVYGFVHQSGGDIRADSEVGRGTTMRLYFPLATSAAPTSEPAPAPVDTRGRGEIVLLLEDEPVVRQAAEMMLRKLGYTVVSAKDGPEALALARQLGRLDLLLTDVILPGGLNGREVAEQLARERPGLRILFASGYSESILLQRTDLNTEPRLIKKPYDLHALAAAVRAALTAPAQ